MSGLGSMDGGAVVAGDRVALRQNVLEWVDDPSMADQADAVRTALDLGLVGEVEGDATGDGEYFDVRFPAAPGRPETRLDAISKEHLRVVRRAPRR